jgi:hypothetical protein
MTQRASLKVTALFAIVTLACSLTGGLAGEESPEATEMQPTEPASSAEATPAGEAAPPTAESASAAGETGEWPPLKSYRIRSVMTVPEEYAPEEAEGPVDQVSIFEWNAAAPISRMAVACVEEITRGDTRWTKMSNGPWREKTLTAEEQAAWEHQWSFAQFWGVEEDLEAALPEGVALVPGQIFPIPIKAAMVFEDEEMVNGVHCRRYAVDTDLDYTNELGHTTGHATGLIWVAHQGGIPPVIVRTVIEEDLVIDGSPTHSSWEHNMTDVNQPVTIEPPE